MRHPGMLVAAVALIGLAACAEQVGIESPDQPEVPPPPNFTINSCSNDDPLGDSFIRYWDCGGSYTVRQSGTGPDLSGAIEYATAAWSLGHGLPSFSYTTSGTSDINVIRDGTSTSGKYCGDTSRDGKSIALHTAESTDCMGSGHWTGTPEQILLHEFGHAVGLGQAYHNFDVAGYSDLCAMNLPSGTGLALTATILCPWETDEVLAKYGVRDNVPDWTAPIITGIGVPFPSTMNVGETQVDSTQYLLNLDGGDSLTTCPPGLGNDFDRCVPLGSATLSWSASPAGKVSLSGGSDGILSITALAPGSVTLTATLTGAGGYQTSIGFESAGFQRQRFFTVNPPTIALYSGNSQSALVSTTLPSPLVVKVTSNGTTPLAGQIVSFTVTGGGGSRSPTTDTTDASGLAQTSWTLGSTEGTQTLNATLSGATGSPVMFSATAQGNHPTGFMEYDCNSGVHTYIWNNTPGYTDFEIRDNSVNNPNTGTQKASGSGTTADIFYTVQGAPVYKYLWVRNTNGGTSTDWKLLQSPFPPQNVSQCIH